MNNEERPYKEIGQRINGLIGKHNTTQKELAQLLNVHPNIISYYCGGSRVPSIGQLIKIADHFNTTVDFLLGRTDNETNNKDVLEVSDFLGLPENTVKALKKIGHLNKMLCEKDKRQQPVFELFNAIIQSVDLQLALAQICILKATSQEMIDSLNNGSVNTWDIFLHLDDKCTLSRAKLEKNITEWLDIIDQRTIHKNKYNQCKTELLNKDVFKE